MASGPDGAAGLALDGVFAGYGDTVVLENINLAFAPGERAAIIGRNGVGKTTLLATIMGLATLRSGTVRIDGEDISRTAVHRRVSRGAGYVPQEREVFQSLTVEENLLVARRPGRWDTERVYDLFPRLSERARNKAGTLSGGEQQMLAVARALMSNPRLLLLDEPSEGLAPLIVDLLMDAFERLAASGEMTILLVEQNVDVALAFAERALILLDGHVAFDGKSADLVADPEQLHALVAVPTA